MRFRITDLILLQVIVSGIFLMAMTIGNHTAYLGSSLLVSITAWILAIRIALQSK